MLTETMEFPSAAEARAYRRQTGCGSYIFEDEDGSAQLIPGHDWRGGSRSHRVAMEHPDLRGRFGKLYA